MGGIFQHFTQDKTQIPCKSNTLKYSKQLLRNYTEQDSKKLVWVTKLESKECPGNPYKGKKRERWEQETQETKENKMSGFRPNISATAFKGPGLNMLVQRQRIAEWIKTQPTWMLINRNSLQIQMKGWGFPGGSVVKSACQCRDARLSPDPEIPPAAQQACCSALCSRAWAATQIRRPAAITETHAP